MRLINFLNKAKFSLSFLYYLTPFSFNFFKISNLNLNYFIFTSKKNFFFFLNFSFLFSIISLKVLNDICVVDYYQKIVNRFKIIYNLTSLNYGFRVFLIFFLEKNFLVLQSLSFLYKSANWLEREVWDLFGLYFLQHRDLRRILTDYGFKGYPFRKDFPLTGYIELRYDDSKRDIVYEPVELTQELRFFSFFSSWELDN